MLVKRDQFNKSFDELTSEIKRLTE
jgi:hypothetical protein